MIASMVIAADIKVGEHPIWNIGGFAIHSDTLISTLVAGAILVGLGLWMRRTITAGVPGKLQLAFEGLTKYIEDLVEQSMGIKAAPFVVPLAVTLFAFILIANWVEIVPTKEHLISPTSDINLTAALAVLVLAWVHLTGFRKKGLLGYVKSFTGAPRWLIPFRAIEEVAKPLSLALRLFGNLFAGGLMIALIGLMPSFMLWAPTVIWKLFDMFIGVIQALIFSLLTIVYFSFAVSEEGH
ncbi:MAG: F-type H+-transporting ATPase subunit a [Frankiales bacterium]|jgi:F-type H+-transporting ATPase subunit a|nr:F-type H+-transporting ATPase subunit a [Frankiales bacterium]MDX6274657.1 F-type H+-transporting ATPase subunit a [Frankiales bacterium]